MSYLLLLRAHWKLLGLGLLCLALAIQTVRLGHRSNQLERAKINLNEVRAELHRISSKKNEQKAETDGRIKEAESREREARPIADKIRAAPIPPNCRTPGLDILRNEI